MNASCLQFFLEMLSAILFKVKNGDSLLALYKYVVFLTHGNFIFQPVLSSFHGEFL